MSETASTPSEGLGIDAAAAQFASILSGDEPTNQEDGEAQVEEPTEPEVAEEEQAAATEDVEDVEEASDDEDAPPAPRTFKVKVDGAEVEVTEDDLIKGYSRTADYTRKTQALAEQRKAFEAEAQAVMQERAEYAKVLSQLQAQLQQATSQEPDWDALYDQDPIEASKLERKWRAYKEQQSAVRAEQERIAQMEQGEQIKRMRSHVASEQAKVLEALPEWKDEAKAKEGRARLISYGKSIGFSDEELGAVYDSRMVKVLADAAAYNALKEKKTSLQPSKSPVKTAAPAATTVKQTSAVTKAKQRLAKTGRVEDAAAIFKGLL